ncbi:MAG: type II toxin-antitoxin system PemK/MazF family toxin, partial [Acidimicrobiia bacterium]|nr:type II toxin-antitoxin system PemK/MazF family toxin [Acidimicrobiia bacterium]
MTPAQGDIWWAEAEDRRRPVLVVTRNEAIPVLTRILVAPVTRTVRDIPTEVPLDTDDGLPQSCAASLDNL